MCNACLDLIKPTILPRTAEVDNHGSYSIHVVVRLRELVSTLPSSVSTDIKGPPCALFVHQAPLSYLGSWAPAPTCQSSWGWECWKASRTVFLLIVASRHLLAPHNRLRLVADLQAVHDCDVNSPAGLRETINNNRGLHELIRDGSKLRNGKTRHGAVGSRRILYTATYIHSTELSKTLPNPCTTFLRSTESRLSNAHLCDSRSLLLLWPADSDLKRAVNMQ